MRRQYPHTKENPICTSVGEVFVAGEVLSEFPGSCFHHDRPDKPKCRSETQTPIHHPECSNWTGGSSASQSRNQELQPGNY